MACRHRLGGHALPAHHAHGRCGYPGHDTPHEERLLGSPGRCYRQRPLRRHRPDPAGPADHVRCLVQSKENKLA